MSKALSNLKKLLEVWEKGSKTAYGKREGLPAIDYWRRVGGQNIGFVGAEGEGRPITGFPLLRNGLMKRTADVQTRKAFGVWKDVKKDEFKTRMFKSNIDAIDNDKEGITVAEYKSAKSKAKARFESILADALAAEGMSRQDFESDMRQSGRSERVFRAFESAKRKMLEANNAQYGTPDASGKAYGTPIIQSMEELNTESPFYKDALKAREKEVQKIDRKFVDCQSIFAKYLMNSDEGKSKNIAVSNLYFSKGRATMQYMEASDMKPKLLASHFENGGGFMSLYEDNLKERSVFHHEFGHFAEHLSKRLFGASIRFLQERSGGDFTAYSMQGLAGTSGSYDGTEFAIPDKFTEPYIGKVYQKSTEVVSMGIQNFENGAMMAALYSDDRDLFYHTIGIVLGEY